MLRRRKKRSLDRSIPHLKDTNIIFIGIEGGSKKSREARYFDIFREDNIRLQIRVIHNFAHRASPLDVLHHLKETIRREPLQEGDEVWLVTDLDRYHEHLPEAARLCKDASINMALSNPCFEFWLLLHLCDPKTEFDECRDVKPLLSKLMNKTKSKSGGYEAIFKNKAGLAVKRAKQRTDDSERWPLKNGSHVYKIVELIQNR